jgi:hypothetical protein
VRLSGAQSAQDCQAEALGKEYTECQQAPARMPLQIERWMYGSMPFAAGYTVSSYAAA